MRRVLAVLVNEAGQYVAVQTECDTSWDALDAVCEALARQERMSMKDVLIEYTLSCMSVFPGATS